MAKAFRYIAANFALFCIYIVTAIYGLRIGAVSGFAAPIWAPSGISLAAVLIFGPWLWPGIALGALLTNLYAGASLPVALCIAFGNTAEAIFAAALLIYFDFRASFQRIKDVLVFFFIVFLTTFFGAIIGVSSHFLNQTLEAPFIEALRSWWIGDIGGEILLTSFFLIWTSGVLPHYSVPKKVELAVISFVIALGSLLIFTDWTPVPILNLPRTYLIFPLMILAAVRLDQRAVITESLIVATIVLGAAAFGHGPFRASTLSESLFHAQIFVSILIGSKMVLAAAIAERRDKESELRNSNAQSEAILKASLDGIITMDHLGRVTEFNPAATRIFGYSRQEVMGKSMADLIIPLRFRDQHKNGLKKYLLTHEGPVLGRRLEMPAIRADGSEFPTELFIEPMNVPGPPMFTGFIQDISEKKLAENARKQSEESEKFLAEATKTISSSIDYKTTLQNILKCAQPMLGELCAVLIYSAKEGNEVLEYLCTNLEKQSILQENVEGLLSQKEAASKINNSILLNEISEFTINSMGVNLENAKAIISSGIKSIMISPLYSQGEKIGLIACATFDAARIYNSWDSYIFNELARRSAMALENARLYKEANEAIYARDEFLSIASHELRTPLTSLSLQLQILSRVLKVNQAKNEASELISFSSRIANSVNVCEAQSKRLTALLDELLDLTRIRLGRLHLNKESLDLASIVREAITPLSIEAKQKGINILIEKLQPSLGSWDRIRMEQIVSNLISNALKYGDGKPITISIENDLERKIARFIVKDEGIGISEEMQVRLFERFERAGVSGKKISGLGLGLYITRQIVEAHGGRIYVNSEVGKGSTFTVELPFDQSSTQSIGPEVKKAG